MRCPSGPVVVDVDGPADEEALRECADVLCCRTVFRSAVDAERAGRQVLACYPGCELIVVPCSGGRYLALARSGAVETVRLCSSACDLRVLAVEWYARLMGGGPGSRPALTGCRASAAGPPGGVRRTR